MAVAAREVGYQRAEEQAPQEQSCWTAFGKWLCNGSLCRFVFNIDNSVVHEYYDRITSVCIKTLKEQKEHNNQHYAIAKWATRGCRWWMLAPNGIRDPRSSEHELLLQRFSKFVPHSSYARFIQTQAKEYPWKLLPDLIFEDASHLNCDTCRLAKEEAQAAKEVRDKTGKRFFEFLLPEEPYKAWEVPLHAQGDRDF